MRLFTTRSLLLALGWVHTGHTDLIQHWVRLADLFKSLISSWINFQMEATSYDPQTEKNHIGIKLMEHVGLDSGSMKHCMPECQDHIFDTQRLINTSKN